MNTFRYCGKWVKRSLDGPGGLCLKLAGHKGECSPKKRERGR